MTSKSDAVMTAIAAHLDAAPRPDLRAVFAALDPAITDAFPPVENDPVVPTCRIDDETDAVWTGDIRMQHHLGLFADNTTIGSEYHGDGGEYIFECELFYHVLCAAALEPLRKPVFAAGRDVIRRALEPLHVGGLYPLPTDANPNPDPLAIDFRIVRADRVVADFGVHQASSLTVRLRAVLDGASVLI